MLADNAGGLADTYTHDTFANLIDSTGTTESKGCGILFMHDDRISSYNVDFKNKTIVIHTFNEANSQIGRLKFTGVLTHEFTCILENNIILDVCVGGIDHFMKKNLDMIRRSKIYGWPFNYQDEDELVEFLINNHYKYIEILSSYGMNGWVLANGHKWIYK